MNRIDRFLIKKYVVREFGKYEWISDETLKDLCEMLEKKMTMGCAILFLQVAWYRFMRDMRRALKKKFA